MDNYTPKHSKREPLRDFCENIALPVGIITGGIIGLFLVSAMFKIY